MQLSDLTEERLIQCPYCGEDFTVIVDCSAGSQSYIEDCVVCCRPIQFDVQVDPDGDIVGLQVRRDDE